MTDNITYSVVVPVYNSENTLIELCRRIINTLSSFSLEIIFVDDSSTDKSWQVIGQLKNEYPAIVKAIQLHKNYGQNAAVSCAFNFCKGNFVITIDDDLQYDPTDILLLIQKQKELNVDVVYGITKKKKHSYIRNLGANYLRFTSKFMDGDIERVSPFRLINKKIIQTIIEHHSNSVIFLDLIIKWHTHSFAYTEVVHYPRLSGKSGYNFLKLFKLYVFGSMNYYILPLKVMTFTGSFFSVISFLLIVHFLYMKMMYDVQAGFTSIIVTILFCSGVIMFYLGIIGQYLFKIYNGQQNKPLYSIKQVI